MLSLRSAASLFLTVVVYMYIMHTVKDQLLDLSVHVQFLFVSFSLTHLLNSWCLMGWTMHRKKTIIESVNIKDDGEEDWSGPSLSSMLIFKICCRQMFGEDKRLDRHALYSLKKTRVTSRLLRRL